MVTQKDVADYAGVSFITVSRVVNKEPNVKEETRRKVEQAIKATGYFPGFAGKALNSGKCSTIAVLSPINYSIGSRSDYLMGVLSGIQEECKKKETDILLIPFSEDDSGFDFLRPFRQRKVDGSIYIGLKKLPEKVLQEIKERKLPCVIVGDRNADSSLSWVDTDNEKAGYETTRRIWEKGHRKIAFYGLVRSIYNANISDREKGYRRAILELSGSPAPEEYIFRSAYDQKSAAENFMPFFSLKDRPTAMFCSTDNHIPPVICELARRGIKVPDEFSVVGFDGIFQNQRFYDFSIATNIQPLFTMGKSAAEILFGYIDKTSSEIRHIEVPVQFTDGTSLASPPSGCPS